MEDLDAILGGFEKALELEQELGERTVECDRALLTPMRPAPAATAPAPRPTVPPAPVRPAVSAALRANPPAVVPAASPVRTAPAPAAPATSRANPPAAVPAAPPVRTAPVVPAARPAASKPDFAFIVDAQTLTTAHELFTKMVGAMGYALDQVVVAEASAAARAHPAARVYVVMGSEALKVFAPSLRAVCGLWTRIDETPTIVTNSPARMIRYFPPQSPGLQAAKRQTWQHLQSALACIGRARKG